MSFTPPTDLDCLTTDLSPVASKWLELGRELEVPMEELDVIDTLITGKQGKAEVCLQRVVLEWLSNSTRPITRDVLVEALGSSSVGEVHCAKELPQGLFLRYCTKYSWYQTVLREIFCIIIYCVFMLSLHIKSDRNLKCKM